MSRQLFNLRISTDDLAESIEETQRLRAALKDRRQLHARVAVEAGEYTKAYLRGDKNHRTANALGAKPTGHRAKSAQGIESDSNADAAIVRIPRSTGLARAFQDFTIVPGSGKKFLTIPADKRTYGRRVREFPDGTFVFAVVGGRFPALMFKDGYTVGYWLKRSVKQKQDRSLLPPDKTYRTITRTVLAGYLQEARSGQKGGPA